MLRRYLLSLDGVVANPALASQLATNSLVLKQESQHLQWFHLARQRCVHYMPIWASSTGDVLDTLSMLRGSPGGNQAVAQRVAANGQAFALTHLGEAGRLRHWQLLLELYAKLYLGDGSAEVADVDGSTGGSGGAGQEAKPATQAAAAAAAAKPKGGAGPKRGPGGKATGGKAASAQTGAAAKDTAAGQVASVEAELAALLSSDNDDALQETAAAAKPGKTGGGAAAKGAAAAAAGKQKAAAKGEAKSGDAGKQPQQPAAEEKAAEEEGKGAAAGVFDEDYADGVAAAAADYE